MAKTDTRVFFNERPNNTPAQSAYDEAAARWMKRHAEKQTWPISVGGMCVQEAWLVLEREIRRAELCLEALGDELTDEQQHDMRIAIASAKRAEASAVVSGSDEEAATALRYGIAIMEDLMK